MSVVIRLSGSMLADRASVETERQVWTLLVGTCAQGEKDGIEPGWWLARQQTVPHRQFLPPRLKGVQCRTEETRAPRTTVRSAGLCFFFIFLYFPRTRTVERRSCVCASSVQAGARGYRGGEYDPIVARPSSSFSRSFRTRCSGELKCASQPGRNGLNVKPDETRRV